MESREWNEGAGDVPDERTDDEVRRDIADELADHLQSSMEREMRREPDAEKASRNALRRFGRPGAVARRLWNDARREKVMFERLHFAITAATAGACLCLGYIAWSVGHESAGANRQLAEEISSLRDVFDSSAFKEWIPGTLRLVTEDGEPVGEGFFVSFDAAHDVNGPVAGLDRTFRGDEIANGVVDLGLLKRLAYDATISTPQGYVGVVRLDARVVPEVDDTAICPSEPYPVANVRIEVEWPEVVMKEGFAVCLNFEAVEPLVREVGNAVWRVIQPGTLELLATSTGEVVIPGSNDLFGICSTNLYGYPTDSRFGQFQWRGGGREDLRRVRVTRAAPLWVGEYRITAMQALPRFESAEWIEELPTRSVAVVRMENFAPGIGRPATGEIPGTDLPRSTERYEVRAGEENVWVIRPPEELVELVRRELGMEDGDAEAGDAEAGAGDGEGETS